jgi:hypothetical protein
MQWLVTRDVSRVDINLDPDHLYVQVFARSGGQHGVLDLLSVTRAKRLAILELKATENPDLPLQAADYWTRIRRHQAQGDLARYGYFSGMQLQPSPPIVYMVARHFTFMRQRLRSSAISPRKWRSSASVWPRTGGAAYK